MSSTGAWAELGKKYFEQALLVFRQIELSKESISKGTLWYYSFINMGFNIQKFTDFTHITQNKILERIVHILRRGEIVFGSLFTCHNLLAIS